MSKKNRKYMYDKLVEANRFDDIDPALIDEFGDPQKKSEPKLVKTEKKPKKKGRKKKVKK
jgi:hypothetical protein